MAALIVNRIVKRRETGWSPIRLTRFGLALLAASTLLVGCRGVSLLDPIHQDNKSASKAITSFSFAAMDNTVLESNVTGSINANAISLIVPHGTVVTALVPTISHSGVSISPSSGTAQDFSDPDNPVVYTVTAEDGSTAEYLVTVFMDVLGQINSFVFEADRNTALTVNVVGVISHDEGEITVTVPYGTDLNIFLTPTIDYSGKNLSPESGVAQRFNQPVTYTLTSANDADVIYTVYVVSAAADSKEITAFRFLAAENTSLDQNVSGTIDQDERTILVNLPYTTSRNPLVPYISITGKSINPISGQARNFEAPVTYTVTAEDDTTAGYMVTVNAVAVVTFKYQDGETVDLIRNVLQPSTMVGAEMPYLPHRIGYEFVGWNSQSDGSGTAFIATTPITSDITVYAIWQAINYTVILDDGAGGGGSNSVSVTFGAAMPSAIKPSRFGYDFSGYFLDSNDPETNYYDADMNSVRAWDIPEHTTLHALWQAMSFQIFFHGNGSGNPDAMSPQTIIFDDTVTINANQFVRAGYAFTGWATSVAAASVVYTDGASFVHNTEEDIELWAVWTGHPTISIELVQHSDPVLDFGELPTVDGLPALSKGSLLTIATNTGSASYHWALDGNWSHPAISGSGPSIEIASADLYLGVHSLYLIVVDEAGYELSCQFDFIVVNEE